LQAAQYGLDRLIAVVDYNHMQSLTTVEKTLKLEPFEQKWRDFGWNAESVNGHDTEALKAAFARAKDNAGSGKPYVILAHTVKGKGISFMENNILWHYRTPQGEEYEAALKELEALRP
jgi:transketolase